MTGPTPSPPLRQPASTARRRPAAPLARGLRLGLAAAALLLSALSVAGYQSWRQNRSELAAILERSGVGERGEWIYGQVDWERTPLHARLAVARALVYDFLNARSVGRPGSPELEAELEARVGQLATARELARGVLAEQPSSWQGLLFLGASTYLERSYRQDRRLYTEAAAWEEPLRRALLEAPGKAEPRRFLATAYLEVWPALSEAKRDFAGEIVAELFAREADTFSRLLPVWLAVADPDEALAVIPDRAQAWQRLMAIHAGERRWGAYLEHRERYLERLEAELEADLERAARHLERDEGYESRRLLLRAIGRAPLEERFAPLVRRALELYSPGLHDLRDTEPLRRWLLWALDLDAAGVEVLPAALVGRLLSAIGELPPSEAAHALLVADAAGRARRLETLTATLATPDWAPYLVAKAGHLVERGEVVEARLALELADPLSRSRPAYLLARWRLAAAAGESGGLAAAEADLAEAGAAERSAYDWRLRFGAWQLELLAGGAPGRSARVLEVELREVPPAGAVVACRWDGATLAAEAVRPGRHLRWRLEAAPGPHLLELEVLAGGEVIPGRVRLLPAG